MEPTTMEKSTELQSQDFAHAKWSNKFRLWVFFDCFYWLVSYLNGHFHVFGFRQPHP